jgi:hypothetical protein
LCCDDRSQAAGKEQLTRQSLWRKRQSQPQKVVAFSATEEDNAAHQPPRKEDASYGKGKKPPKPPKK